MDVYGRYTVAWYSYIDNYSNYCVYKPTYNWGGPSLWKNGGKIHYKNDNYTWRFIAGKLIEVKLGKFFIAMFN